MKHRVDRVRELVKRELGDLIHRELSFEQLVTIQEVDMTPDLKQAHVFVSVLGGGPEAGREVITRLLKHRKELQGLLAKRIVLKYTPHLHFKLDEAIVRGTEVINILESLNLPPLVEGEGAAPAEEAPSHPEEQEKKSDTDLGDDESRGASEE